MSPSVRRIIAVLNFFLEHPQQPFTLTQVAKSLRLSRATGHSILLSFVDAGYLYRRPDKSYVLGLALPTLAASALSQFTPLAVAGQEMRALADELDVVASALFPEGDKMVVRERAASVNNLGIANRAYRGPRPIHPGGNVLKVGLSDAAYEASLDAVTPPLTEEAKAEFRADIQFARKHGFSVALVGNTDENGFEIGPPGPLVSELRPKEVYNLRHIIAPVLDDVGQAAFAISLYGFRRAMSGTEVLEVGRMLRETCRRISSFISGKRL